MSENANVPFAEYMMVNEQLRQDQLSWPRIATILRRWGIKHDHISRIDLYHTGLRYSLAILLVEPVTVALIQKTNRDLMPILNREFSVHCPETYVVGTGFLSAPMFQRLGSITIINKSEYSPTIPL